MKARPKRGRKPKISKRVRKWWAMTFERNRDERKS